MKKAIILVLVLSLTLLTACGTAKSGTPAVPYTDTFDFYTTCTDLSAETVESFAEKVKALILAGDWEGLSAEIAYPIATDGTVYADAAAFAAAAHEELVSDEFKAALEAEDCRAMFCNSDGIMLADGQVWFSEIDGEDGNAVLKVSSLGTGTSQIIKPGVWLANAAEDYQYYFFNEDGTTGSNAGLETGTGVAFKYEITGNDAIFYMGADDAGVPATVEFSHNEQVTIKWAEGIEEVLTYVSNETADSFFFYSNTELCDMALSYYAKVSGNDDVVNTFSAGTMTNEDGTVTIQVYENLGDHNSTADWYTVDRQTAIGTDMSGAEIDLTK